MPLNGRALRSLQIRNPKPGVKMGLYDPRCVEEVLQRIGCYNKESLYNEHLREIYIAILGKKIFWPGSGMGWKAS